MLDSDQVATVGVSASPTHRQSEGQGWRKIDTPQIYAIKNGDQCVRCLLSNGVVFSVD
jgi:hypothetical protein